MVHSPAFRRKQDKEALEQITNVQDDFIPKSPLRTTFKDSNIAKLKSTNTSPMHVMDSHQ